MLKKWLLNETSHLNEWQSFEILEMFGFWREFWRFVRTCLEYIYIFSPKKNRPCREQLHCILPYVKDILKTRVVWGRRNGVDGEHWRTSVCVNNSQIFLSTAAEERWRWCKAWVRWANQRRYTQKAQHKFPNSWIFLILPRNYTKVKVIVESLWWWRPNCKQGLKAEVHFYQKNKGRRGKGKHTHTDSKIGFPWFSKSETIETDWSKDGPRLKSDNLRRGCRLQERGAVQGWSESQQRVIAHRRGGREARLARGGIREHDVFLGHEMRGPGLDVLASRWLGGGPRRKKRGMGWRAIACHHRHVLF